MMIRTACAVLSLAGVLTLILGLLHWTGVALNLVSMHMLLGFVTVGALGAIGIGQAFSTTGSWIIAAFALGVGLVTIVFGMIQASLWVGDHHWVVEVIHLALGLLTIGMGHMVVARNRKRAAG